MKLWWMPLLVCASCTIVCLAVVLADLVGRP